MHKEREQLVNLHKNNHAATILFVKDSDRVASVVVPSLIVFILFVISVPKFDISAVLVYAAFPLFTSIAFRVPFATLIKRLLLLSPFILIMAAANPILDRKVYLSIGDIAISGGMVSGVVIVAKSMIAISSVMIFSMCIQFTSFCKVLRTVHTPEIFVTQLQLLYRYSFLLVDEAMALQRARNMRSFGKSGRGIITTGKLIGSLLLRTTSHADHIYRAMVARGFNGDLDKSNRIQFSITDIGLIGLFIAVFLLIRILF